MAAIAVTYTFTNGTTSDGTQVSQNFTDLVNGLGDGTKDIAVNAISTVGNTTFNGNTIIGNATGDDVTIGGSLAATLNIKTTNAFDIGTSAIGLRAFYFGANSKTAKIVASASQSADWTFTLPIGGEPLVIIYRPMDREQQHGPHLLLLRHKFLPRALEHIQHQQM